MPTVIKLKIQVDEIDNVLTQFDQLKVYRSVTGILGPYAEITTPATRIPLQQGTDLYTYDDLGAQTTHYYKTAYYNSVSALESDPSCARLGADPESCNIMSIDELKQIYLFGLDLTNDAGEPFPDLMFEWAIKWATANVERQLDIRIRPTTFVGERYDYYREDYQNWTFIRLRECPVISVSKVAVKWPSNSTVIEFPTEWIQLRPDAGQITILPTSGSFSQVLLTAGGGFLPLVSGGLDFAPDIFEIDFVAGFRDGEAPIEIRDAIGKYATFPILNTAGDLIAGAGIANKSISIDGLSQSIGTTSSATNSGYGSRLLQYTKELKDVMPNLRRYYKGMRLTAL